MGAAVLEDVPDGETWVGVPARPVQQSVFNGTAAEL
jgi:serine acetyltransferase